jgi:ABC-type transport system involved in multi-copper enzyme maturation permease subunit
MSGATGPAATLGRLRAVAALTFLEAVRRRIFLIVIIVGVAIVSSAAFFPTVDPAGRLRLIEIWAIRTVTVFCSLGAIFLAGFSLPGDFEARRVYTLVTKPVHKGTLFLGKFLGFVLLMALFLLIMAVLTLAYIRLVAATTSDFPECRAVPKHLPDELKGVGAHLTEPERGGLAVRYGQDGEIVWAFQGLPVGRFPDRVSASARVDLRRLTQDFRLQAQVRIRAINPETQEAHEQTVLFQTNRPTPFKVPAKAISADGRLQIRVSPADSDLQVAAWPDGLSIDSNPVSFEVNFLKGMILVLLQSTLVLLMTLAASTFVSGPVSILLGICLFLVGSTWSFVTESLEDIDLTLREVDRRAREGAPPPPSAEDIPPWLLRASGAVSRVVLKAIPNFDSYNFAEWLLTDTAVAGRDIAAGLGAFAPRAAALLVVGLLCMTFRDFAT